ncbi:MAG: phosphonate ABC transporter, permease protein PhnE [Ignavibacteriae bacterium]|nr:phosphonate ABC transporter, permease protein PhnE [Ignavibacteriota bacterium]
MSYSSKTKSARIVFYIQSFLLDVFFGGYLAAIADRILYPYLISNVTASDPTSVTFILYGTFAVIFAIFSSTFDFSLSAKILGKPLLGWQNSVAQNIAWIIGITSIIAGWVISKISPVDFFSVQGLGAAKRLFGALLTPNLDIFDAALFAIIETIYIALIATLIALPFSFILSFLSARNLMKNHPVTFTVYYCIRLITNITRSIEPLIWAIIFSVWVGIGPFAGMLALMVHTVSSLTKQYSEQIEDIDTGAMEAIEATGAHPLQVIWFAVVPQIMIPFLSFTIYRWDINVRMATIIGLVGGGGIGSMLMQYSGLAKWHEVGLIVFMIALIVWVMDYVSAKVREALV